MKLKYQTTTHIIQDQYIGAYANISIDKLSFLKNRTEITHEIKNNVFDKDYFRIIADEKTNVQSTESIYKIIKKADDRFSRRPWIEIDGQIPRLYTFSMFVGNFKSIDFSNSTITIETSYNNIYFTDIDNTNYTRKLIGFICKNMLVITDNNLENDYPSFYMDYLGPSTLTFEREIQTIYFDFEYPYLLNGTLNDNVYDWSDSQKLLEKIPITNIFAYDEDGNILLTTVLSQPIEKTIAQNLKIRVKYDI